MNNRLPGLKLIKIAIGECIKLLDKMSITPERTDDDLREVLNNFNKAKIAVNNSLHTYKNIKGE